MHDANWVRCVYSQVAVAINFALVKSAPLEPSAAEDAVLVSDRTLAILEQPLDADNRKARNLYDLLALSEGAILAELALVRLMRPPPPPSTSTSTPPTPDETPRQRLSAHLQHASAEEIVEYVEQHALGTRSGSYNLACCFSYRYELTKDKSNLPKALANLRAAAESRGPKFKASVENDPALRALKEACPREWDEVLAGLASVGVRS